MQHPYETTKFIRRVKGLNKATCQAISHCAFAVKRKSSFQPLDHLMRSVLLATKG